ncbi:30S ribosomal protein S8e [Candidatus Woesearchaeota archaeon]|nr:30S ribosomal protein S8e [Candidatus Woesearchaeota archaeon]
MAISQFRSKKKITGGKYDIRSKKLKNRGSIPTLTKLDKKIIKLERTRAGHRKIRLYSDDMANVYNPKTKKYEKLKIITVKENPANRHFIRRNIMTKGAIIKTDKGMARITSRPGQENTINAVLIEK